MSKDITSQFQEVFEEIRKKTPASKLDQLKAESKKQLKSVLTKRRAMDNPFQSAVEAVTQPAEKACLEAQERIMLALSILDDVASLEKQRELAAENLLLSEVALSGANSAIVQVITKVGSVSAPLVKSKTNGADIVEHTTNALKTLSSVVQEKRIAVALAREEIENYKTFLFQCSRSGVLLSPYEKEAKVMNAMSEEESRKAKLMEEITARNAAAATAAKDDDDDGQGKKEVSRPRGSKRAAVVNHTSKFMASAISATSTATKKIASRVRDASDVAVESVTGAGGVGAAPSLSTPAPKVFVAEATQMTKDARRFEWGNRDLSETQLQDLRDEHVQLLEQQHDTRENEAMKVEASIRELGLLTTIMQEKVALQAEQVMTIDKHVKESRDNLAKASTELEKPLESRWSMKRMIIGFLWLNIVVLWIADKIVR